MILHPSHSSLPTFIIIPGSDGALGGGRRKAQETSIALIFFADRLWNLYICFNTILIRTFLSTGSNKKVVILILNYLQADFSMWPV